ncbi:aldose epimerase [Paenibacillus helianthi]|uniref:Aldose epimerase n=1 Tax=Paenibacillus helianthi TaxID=1349432 RepID=A0ABX3EIP4_9BACL|nr:MULTISPECIES: aldose 1-epimerase family protein [Paenibacillus]OKP82220.1 aldose epimerase [Paenibacillus sp. P32E]OKP83505.1 aldose epimerase [Paenibacillus helianthi]
MNTILRSSSAQAEISTLGAELVSFTRKDTGTEYIWSGDAAYWTGRSPVLFPIIGAVRSGEIKVQGQAYKLANHGFARRSEFTVVEASESRAVFRLTSSEHTLASYPFQFNLYITYTLNENTLKLDYRVENIDQQDIFFQLGTHPAFNCPLDENGSFSDYVLEFSETETLEREFLNSAGLRISGQSEPVLKGGRILPLTHEMFKDDALVFQNVASRQITLKSKLTAKSVAVSFEGFPDLGIWQKLNAPFLCIEPWQGFADRDTFDGELQDKEGVIALEPGATFASSLTIEIN